MTGTSPLTSLPSASTLPVPTQEQLLDRQLLWLACRHHILELVIGAAFRSIFGDTKSPVVTLFKTLKTSWNSLDLDSFVLPEIPSSYQKEKDKLLSFINFLLSPEEVKKLPRCDYKELLELSKVTLGESIERKKGYLYKLQRPGADHHARWMSKAIYILHTQDVPSTTPAGSSLANKEES